MPLKLIDGPLPLLVSDSFPARHAFTTRIGGVSTGRYATLNLGMRPRENPDRVRRNQEAALRAAGAPENLFVLSQKVASEVLVAGRDSMEGDGLVTDHPGRVLLTYSADCCLTLLADPRRKVVASIHASRPGTRGGILRNAVEVMRRLGSDPRDIAALVGPSIGPCCYDVYGPVLEDWRRFGPAHLQERDGKFFLDLKGAVRYQLEAAGVPSIEACDLCTFCRSDWFFSSRRDGEDTGRFGGLVWLEA